MNAFGNAMVAAGLATETQVELSSLNLKQLKARRDAVLRVAIATQGKTYKHAKSGSFRKTSAEQAELLAINAEITKRRGKR